MTGVFGIKLSPMTDAQRLTLVRALHTVIYVVMAGASLVVLYAGITGAHGPWLWVAAALVAAESSPPSVSNAP